ncbi:MAG: chitobiase/beta-hexosaminidase C-terminal domain-containing protein, partial [Anaerolineales bacterium]|nr:chitobiase/beta-hexosaminidase C-terminal domain-containing protein [Anaerolineales bacterium]
RGIAYGATLYFAAAKTTTGGYDVGNGVLECAAALDVGDVILIEQQTAGPNYVAANAPSQVGLVPVEWVEAWYDDIVTAVAQGMVVVEAAGNGSQDLDSNTYTSGNGGHFPFQAVNDSGAIIVGAGRPPSAGTNARSAESFSNYGATVDVQGWGSGILTTGYGSFYNSEGTDLWYTSNFGGTSGASPMVTSAAAIVQAIYTAENSSPATPAEVKEILQTTGTAQNGSKNIGPLPDLRAAINSISAGETVSPPVITPASGTYNMPLEVTINYAAGQNSGNTHIRYTLNGNEPTFNDFIFYPDQGDTLYLNYGVTVKAKAFRVGGGESATATAVYQSSTPKVAAPVITPGAGTYNQPHQVTLSTTTPGAEIRYRTDGRAPSFFYPGTVYNGPIALGPGNYEIVARGYKDGYYKSDATYSGDIVVNEITLPTPTIYPGTGTYNGSVTAYIGSTVLGAEIRYTTDGSTPTDTSPQFSEPLYFEETTMLKARIYLDGYSPSDVVEVTYTVIQQAAAPTFSPPSGSTADDTLQVTLSTATAGATIRYTTNGAEPTSYSTVYTGPFNLGVGQHTVKAKAFLSGASASATATATYDVFDSSLNLEPPVVYPAGGNHNGPITVTISSDEDVLIFYTLDATDPLTSPTVKSYNGPFPLYGNDTYYVRARAFKSGVGNSEMSDLATLVVVTPTLGVVEAPTFSVPSGTYSNTFSIMVDAPDHNPGNFRVRTLFIREDGTDPFVNFDPGPGNPEPGDSPPEPVNISTSKTVKAIAAQAGWTDSPIATAEYVLQCDTPTITAGGVYTDEVAVMMSSGTAVAQIYYTTDGSAPTTADVLYTAPFTLTQSTTVRAFCTRTNFEDSESVTEAYVVVEAPVAPSIDSQPQSSSVNTCDTAVFSVTASGSDPLWYEWRKDGKIIAGQTEPELEIAAVKTGDAGDYTVIVSNAAGDVTSDTVTLTVSGEDVDCTAEAPAIITQPQSQTVAACGAVTLSVTAAGSEPLSYQWFKNDDELPGETAASLTFDPVRLVDAADYTVVVTNTGGTDTSDVATLTVTGDDAACQAVAPTITTQPQSQTVTACEAVTFSVAASGTAPFSYQWFKGTTELPGETGATLTIDPVLLSDAGAYSVEVTNTVDSDTSTAATLTVTGDDTACGGGGNYLIYLPLIIR